MCNGQFLHWTTSGCYYDCNNIDCNNGPLDPQIPGSFWSLTQWICGYRYNHIQLFCARVRLYKGTFYKNFASKYFKIIDGKYNCRLLKDERVKQRIDVTDYWILAESPRTILISGNILFKYLYVRLFH